MHQESDLNLSESTLVRPSARRPSRSLLGYVLVSVAIIAACATVIFAVLKFKGTAPRADAPHADTPAGKLRILDGSVHDLSNHDEPAFKLALDETAWAPANDIRKSLGAATAWRHPGPNKAGWFAVAVRDYGQANPREGELLRAGVERLERQFQKSLEWAEKAEPVTGIEAQPQGPPWQRLLFKGQLNSVVWWGYMYMTAQQGIGYWLYVAAPTKEAAEAIFTEDLVGTGRGLQLSSERRGWREQTAKIDSFATADGILTLSAPQGVFDRLPAKDADEHGVLHLFARYQKEQDNRKNADIMVLAFPKQADAKAALAEAKKYLEDKQSEESKDYSFEELGKALSEAGPGLLVECKVLRGGTPTRYWLVGVPSGRDNTFVIRCDATWENRQIWRADFLRLLGSVKLKEPRTK